jgi:serine protease
MKIAVFATLLCLAVAMPYARIVHNMNNPARVAGEFLIVLNAPAAQVSRLTYATQVASRIVDMSPSTTILNMFTNLLSPILHVKTSDEASVSQFYNLAEVKVIDSNLYENMIQACANQNTGSDLWGLSRISSDPMPDYNSAQYNYDTTDGQDVRVYVLDTGIRITHNDFGGRAVFGARFATGDDTDGNGHGTHCAGTIGGGEYGVSKAVTVVAVKVLGDSGSGLTSWIVNGIDWAVGDATSRGVRGVGSLSLGGGANSAMDEAVNSADAAGVAMVVAAGNSNADACNYSPARAPGAITVAASDNSDHLSSFSNWGSCVDIIAPGSSIKSAWYTSDTATNTISGTSMACPHVAGLAATYFAENPSDTPNQLREYLTTTSSKDRINLRGHATTPNRLLYTVC